jgi:phosphoribosylformylglycinamidine (FGAM) synthase-like amidotransferase family enzyme
MKTWLRSPTLMPTAIRSTGAIRSIPTDPSADIAGICNRRGNVVGLMPHPEDHIVSIQNPLRGNGQSGLALFEAFLSA